MESVAARQDILENIELMQHAASLLEQSSIGARGLLGIARAAENEGLFSEDFAAVARGALEEAGAGLSLAQVESAALGTLIVDRGSEDSDSPSVLGFGNVISLSPQALGRVDDVLDRAVESTRFMTAFLGFNGPRSYLMLAQNQQEIRATGGFIGSAIRVTVDQGELVEIDFKDSTTIDLLPPEHPNNPLPPEPIYWYLWMGRLLFRDANWSPNFPTAAALVADLYRLGQGVQLDGVITGSKALLVDLVDLLGDIRVPDVSGPLTGEQAQAYTDGILPYECSERHVSTRGKRCFNEDAFFAIKDRVTSTMSGTDRAALGELIRDELSQGNIQAHLFDVNEGSLLWDLGWNGAIPPVDHDYLLIVDSSLPGHITPYVRRSWHYEVKLEAGRPIESKLRLRYNHEGEFRDDRVCRQSEPESSNCYWNYFRVYIPTDAFDVVAPPIPLDPGAEKLIWGYPDPDSLSLVRSADVGPARLTEIGGFLTIPPDSVTTVPLEYQLPWETIRSTGDDTFEYRLLVQKQPGIDSDVVNIAVNLPLGSEMVSALPEPTARSSRWLTFDFRLDTDKQVVVVFRALETG